MAEIKMTCPRCGSGGCFYNTDKHVGHCFACGSALQQWHLKEVPKGTLAEHAPLPSVSLECVDVHPAATEYLWKRGVPESEWGRVLFEPDERALYFRIWSPSPEFAPSYHCRFVDGGKMRWRVFPGTRKEHYLFGDPLEDRVCLVEGIFDALRVGKGAVALLGSELYPTQVVWLRRFPRVVVWGDYDAAGFKLMERAQNLLQGVRCWPVAYTKDTTDPINKEAGDCLPGHPLLESVKQWLKA